jgi:thiamine pyrophosphokinase
MAMPDLLLCADGGANTVRRYGAEPDVVVGDLDSASAETLGVLPADRQLRVDADNTGTDLNKVLTHAVSLGVREAVLLGVTGRRTDHTLWNLSLLKRFSQQMRLRITDDYCHIYLLGEQSVTRFAVIVGQRLSLSPLDGAVHGVTTEGLRWELTAAELVPGVRDGISNEVVQSPVSIEVRGPGHLLLITQREGEEGGEIELR